MQSNTPQSSIWAGGLIAIGLIIFQGFLSLSPLDPAAFVSVFAFAIAIPILACNLLLNFKRAGTKDATLKATNHEIIFYLVGMLAALIGIVAAFWHICKIAAILFFGSFIIALIVYFKVQRNILN